MGIVTKKKKQTASTKLIHHTKRLLVPHKANHYRPHLIRVPGLVLVAVLLIAIQVGYGLTSGHILGQTAPITSDELLQDSNAERAKDNLPALSLNDKLDQAAYLKAKDMFANNYWAHNSPSGVTPWAWFAAVGYNYDKAGENLAKNYVDTQATVNAWMASPTHRANILNADYKDVGFAVMDGTLNGQPTTLVVAEYGEPVSVATVAGAQTTYEAPINTTSSNPLASFASTIQTLNPASVAILGILALVGVVAAVAHHFRKKLPKNWVKSWRVHHGAYTLGGVLVAAVVVTVASGGGQI
jgi:hypothetical protein